MQAETGRLRVVAPETSDGAPEDRLDAVESGPPPRGPSPGAYIREQRQRRGMSVEQLAVATKIPAASLRLLEDDKLDALPGPVFVKGFLRCAARALGLGPDAVMELLYEQERAALKARRAQRAPMASERGVGEFAGDEFTGDEFTGASPGVRRLSNRAAKRSNPAADGIRRRLAARMPSASLALWIAIAVMVAMIVLAAFNLVGSHMSGPI